MAEGGRTGDHLKVGTERQAFLGAKTAENTKILCAEFDECILLKRPPRPEEIAPAYVFLASPQMLELRRRRNPGHHRGV